MVEAVERLVNLAFFLADAREPVSAEQVRSSVDGYPENQDEAAFIRMFERDKDVLRSAGLVIESDGANYRLDAAATFASEVRLTALDAAVLRAVGIAMLDDPGFPFAEELRLALAKVSSAGSEGPLGALEPLDAPIVSHIADERPEQQADAVLALNEAISLHKRASFEYTNAKGEHKHHEIEPYGLFVREGRWYLVGRDVDIDQERVYALPRIESLEVNPRQPKTPDYEIPEGFDVAGFVGMPFQYGPDDRFEAVLAISAEQAWRGDALTGDKGDLETLEDGSLRWRIPARNRRRLMRWIVENGPGITPLEPTDLAETLAESYAKVVEVHG